MKSEYLRHLRCNALGMQNRQIFGNTAWIVSSDAGHTILVPRKVFLIPVPARSRYDCEMCESLATLIIVTMECRSHGIIGNVVQIINHGYRRPLTKPLMHPPPATGYDVLSESVSQFGVVLIPIGSERKHTVRCGL
jgi:hypothetical protein